MYAGHPQKSEKSAFLYLLDNIHMFNSEELLKAALFEKSITILSESNTSQRSSFSLLMASSPIAETIKILKQQLEGINNAPDSAGFAAAPLFGTTSS